MRSFYYTLCLFLLVTHTMVAQLIKVDEAVTNQEIIEQLVSGCIQITNVNITGSPDFKSYGVFTKASSNFPFNNGILLSSGNVSSAGNSSITNNLNEGSQSWGTDPDIENYTESKSTLNATTIEFDFISATNFISFNYILASEEYGTNFICNYADGFAFLIKEASASNYTNIAVLPDNTTVVNTKSVNGGYPGQCPPSNLDYFEGINLGDTNFNGRTKVLTASLTIVPYTTYHIKLIIADQGDVNYDSAVFIEGNSFEAAVDLGPDINTCTPVTLNADIDNSTAIYNWYKDGIKLTNDTKTLDVSESGTYKVSIDISINGEVCPYPIEDEIIVDFNIPVKIDLGNTLATRCDDDGNNMETFSLDDYNQDIIDLIKTYIADNGYDITFHNSMEGALNNTDKTNSPITINAGDKKTIYTRIEGQDFECTGYLQFDLIVNQKPDIEENLEETRCDGDVTFSLNDFDTIITRGTTDYVVTYHYTREQAELGQRPITGYYKNINETDTIYVRVEDSNTGCLNITTLKLKELNSPKINNANDYVISGCATTTGNITFDLTEAESKILDSLELSEYDITYHNSQADAETGNNPISNPETYITDNPETIFLRIIPKGGGCASIAVIDVYPNVLLSITEEQLSDYANCGGSTFDLYLIANDISNGIEGLEVRFFSDASYLNKISKTNNYTITNGTNSQLIYIEMTLDDCPDYSVQSDFYIFTTEPLDYKVPVNPMHCDASPTIDFASELNPLIDYNDKGYTIKYYLTETDRDLDKNELPPFLGYDNTETTIPIWARVIYNIPSTATNPNGICYDPINFEIQISQVPTVNISQDNFSYCVTNSAVKTPIQAIIDEISANTTPDDSDIKIYTTLEDAELGNSHYLATIDSTASTTLYSRVSNVNNTGCAIVDAIDVRVFLQPVFSEKNDFFACGVNDFPVKEIDKNALLTNYSSALFTIKYYNTESGTPIKNTSSVDVSSGPVTIYVEALNKNSTNCVIGKTITLSSSAMPEYEEPTDFYICLAASNTTFTLDLSLKVDEISSGHSGLDITFYTNENDAVQRTNPLPLNYSNTQNVIEIFARIENLGVQECYEIVSFGVYSAQDPDITDASPLVNCATDYIGENVMFDLTQSEFKLNEVRPDGFVTYYFEKISDIEAITDPTNITTNIQNPTQYIKASGSDETVYVAVINTASGCYTAKPIVLSTTPPPQTKALGIYEFCETPSKTLNLNAINNLLVYDLSTVNINYFATQSDAENDTSPLNTSSYNYLSSSKTVYAKIQDLETGCYIIKAITLSPQYNNFNNLNFSTNSSAFETPNQITVSVSGGSGNYMYSLDHDAWQTSNVFEDVSIGVHDITVLDLNGCAELTKEAITLNIPKFFTPNADGFHDTWHIIGVEDLDQAEIFIFDRYGKLLKSLYKDTAGWDGTFRGQPMPTSDYWFVANIVFRGNPIKKKGHFTLKR